MLPPPRERPAHGEPPKPPLRSLPPFQDDPELLRGHGEHVRALPRGAGGEGAASRTRSPARPRVLGPVLRPGGSARQVKDAVNAGDLHLEAGRIEFENVHFSYVDGYGALGRAGVKPAMGSGTGTGGTGGGPELCSLSQEGNPAGRLLLRDAWADPGPGESRTLGFGARRWQGLGGEGLALKQDSPSSLSPSHPAAGGGSVVSPKYFERRWDPRARGRAPSSACSSASTTCGAAASASTGRTSPR